MDALTAVALELHEREGTLTELEWRTYVWARSSLAVLLSIRADQAFEDVTAPLVAEARFPLQDA